MSVPTLRLALALALVVVVALPGCSCSETESGGGCGNGVVEEGEECDDGNTAAGDGCSGNCEVEPPAVCGNGIVESGEYCDDNNNDDGDGCSADCQNECGNGVVDLGEECDDGNNEDGDGCSADCRWQTDCGNGVVEGDEECDDGNDIPWDGCEDNCVISAEEVICATLDPLASGTCEVVAGNDLTLILGDVLGPYTIFIGGEVLVDAAGQITCVGCGCNVQADGATEIRCPRGVISPGLINPHDHITYAHNPPYTDTGERYEHRHEWRRGLNGHTEIPYSGGASTDEIRWGELRFLMGGATSTVGSGSAIGFLRNLDKGAQEGLGQEPVHYETFPLGDSNGTMLSSSCAYPNIDTQADIAGDDAYFPHVSEGINAEARNEFICTGSEDGGGEDLLEPQSAYIHGIGLTPIDYARMADQGTTLVWSARTNVTLYGDTAVVTAAARLGVRIALGTDWMPTGSMNLQRELRCADSLNQTYFDNFFTDRELWKMVTEHAAGASAMDDAIGTLAEGRVADIAIFAAPDGDPPNGADSWGHRAVIDAAPDQMVLVIRGGTVLYGDSDLVSDLASGTCDTMDVCGVQKRLCASGDIGKSLSDLQTSVGNAYPLFFCGVPDDEPSCKPMRSVSVNGSTIYSGDPTSSDADGDGIDDGTDNCPNVFNPVRPVDDGQQGDFDLDGAGDACDPCPLDPGTTDCSTYDGGDVDADGVANDVDNCPNTPNDDQADGDNDDKGDVCDPCPTVSNPGDLACPATIYAIKQGSVTGPVAVENALVTGCKDGSGYFVQVKAGDADYISADHSGIFVYDSSTVCPGGSATLEVGDRVTLNPATASDFFGQIQLSYATIAVLSSGEAAPTPVSVTAAAAGGSQATALEAVLVKVDNVLVSELEPAPGPGDTSPTNEFVVDGVLKVNDFLHLTSPFPTVNTPYASITGILDYRNGSQKLEPRDQNDLEAGTPVLVGFDPPLSFVRQGDMGTATIPTPLTVSLSGPAQTNTLVTIASATPGSIVATGGGVTVPQGSATAPVLVNALQQAMGVTLTASLNSVQLTADVRVIGPGEQPQVVSIDPPLASLAPQGTAPFTVFLDIPADNPGGNTVSLSLSPGTFGSVPATVPVLADQLSAGLTFMAGTQEGNELLTALLNGGSGTATIEVKLGSGLVLNEVDYDQVGTDTEEFVEILNTTGAPVSLNGLALVMINGSNDTEYKRIDLSPEGTLAAGEYLVVGSATLLNNVPPSAKTIAFGLASNNIQNGAPDALGILDVQGAVLLDALSYEGSVTAGNITGVGPTNFVEGNPTAVLDNNTAIRTLIRNPNGSDTDDAATDWAYSSTPTPGAVNVP